jgi:hypothetical protein
MAVELVPNEVGLNVIVKNTFLDLDEGEDTGCAKRCSSVPRAWKPLSPTGSFFDGERASVSTTASDDELSEVSARSSSDLVGAMTNNRGCGPEASRPKAKLNPGAAEFTPCSPLSSPLTSPQVPMMMPMLSSPFGGFGSPMMKVCAPPASPPPMPAPSEEVTAVLSAAKSALLGNKHVADVKLVPELCTPGTASTLNVELKPLGAKEDQDAEKEVCCAGKAALIAACDHSQSTYVMGYEASPFKDVTSSDEPGFRATISAVPDSMQELVCWEMYQKGTCRNQGMCQWYHPVPAHLLPIQLILRRPAAQTTTSA